MTSTRHIHPAEHAHNHHTESLNSLSTRALRTCFGQFATGVVVVTYKGSAGPRGITINSFTSVSLDPPLILVSIAKSARSHDHLAGQPFAVNILGAEQQPVAERFAGHSSDVEVGWAEGSVPALTGCLAQLICEPWDRFDAGDHTLFIGRVTALEHNEGHALTFHNSRFGQLVSGGGIER